jgi:hypothetical protein
LIGKLERIFCYCEFFFTLMTGNPIENRKNKMSLTHTVLFDACVCSIFRNFSEIIFFILLIDEIPLQLSLVVLVQKVSFG